MKNIIIVITIVSSLMLTFFIGRFSVAYFQGAHEAPKYNDSFEKPESQSRPDDESCKNCIEVIEKELSEVVIDEQEMQEEDKAAPSKQGESNSGKLAKMLGDLVENGTSFQETIEAFNKESIDYEWSSTKENEFYKVLEEPENINALASKDLFLKSVTCKSKTCELKMHLADPALQGTGARQMLEVAKVILQSPGIRGMQTTSKRTNDDEFTFYLARRD